MKCRNCNAEVKVGDIFCTKCGEEIKIVPDYNILDEDDMTIPMASDDLGSFSKPVSKPSASRKKVEDEDDEEDAPVDPKEAKKKKKLYILLGVIAALAVILGVSLLITNHQKNRSFDYQYELAKDYLDNDRPDKALEAINKALDIEKDNQDALYLLAEIQVALEEDDEAVNTLLDLINLYPDNEEAYELLINIYDKKDDYKSIAELAEDVEDEDILKLFEGYVPTTPVFSVEAGDYDSEFSVEITSDSVSQIYYTVDGSDPKENGLIYNTDIQLTAGKTTIRAIATNEFGVFSKEVEATYNIELAVPDKPQVSLASGTYDQAELVAIDVPADCVAYYTWDGSTPTTKSIKYKGPFQIIEGNNVLSVVIVNSNNQFSDVARFNYIYYPENEDVEAEE